MMPTMPMATEAHHHHVEHALAAHHAAVEERQTRRHEQHERGGREHPRGVPVCSVNSIGSPLPRQPGGRRGPRSRGRFGRSREVTRGDETAPVR